MSDVRPYPYAGLPRMRRQDASLLRRALRRLPGQEEHSALEAELARFLGVEISLERGLLEVCAPGELARSLGDPLVALVFVPAAPARGRAVAVELEPALASWIIDRVLGGNGADVPPDLGPLGEVERGVLAYAAAQLLRAHNASLRVVTVLTSAAALELALGDEGALCVPASVQLGDARGTARVWLSRMHVEHGPELPVQARYALLRSLRVPVIIEAGRAVLRTDEVGSLQEGDVVVLDETRVRRVAGRLEGEVRAAARGGSLRVHCALEGERLVVKETSRAVAGGRAPRRAPGFDTDKRGILMDEEKKAAAVVEAAGDVPVELVVELARFEMPVAELASLRAGEVLGTGRAIGDRVVLRAGERSVALGELVDIEGEVGVRILSLTAP